MERFSRRSNILHQLLRNIDLPPPTERHFYQTLSTVPFIVATDYSCEQEIPACFSDCCPHQFWFVAWKACPIIEAGAIPANASIYGLEAPPSREKIERHMGLLCDGVLKEAWTKAHGIEETFFKILEFLDGMQDLRLDDGLARRFGKFKIIPIDGIRYLFSSPPPSSFFS
jgi:hypothetical protein